MSRVMTGTEPVSWNREGEEGKDRDRRFGKFHNGREIEYVSFYLISQGKERVILTNCLYLSFCLVNSRTQICVLLVWFHTDTRVLKDLSLENGIYLSPERRNYPFKFSNLLKSRWVRRSIQKQPCKTTKKGNKFWRYKINKILYNVLKIRFDLDHVTKRTISIYLQTISL